MFKYKIQNKILLYVFAVILSLTVSLLIVNHVPHEYFLLPGENYPQYSTMSFFILFVLPVCYYVYNKTHADKCPEEILIIFTLMLLSMGIVFKIYNV